MGIIKKLAILAFIAAFIAIIYPRIFNSSPELPKVEEKWFGKTLKAGEPIPKDPLTINKFSVNISDTVLQDLKKRLESTRFVEPISGTQFNYGFNSDYLRKVVEYWKTKFDWRKQELVLNKFNHYKTQINGINIHYVHVKPSKPAKTVIPILLLHTWPGSFWEYYKAIPLLIEPTDGIAFEVICPSTPGQGFSDPPRQIGFDTSQTARIFSLLMDRLQHKEYFVHGEDFGNMIARTMAILYPNNVKGIHLTIAQSFKLSGIAFIKYFIGMFFPALVFDNPEKDYNKLFPIKDKINFLLEETGCLHMMSTKPDTIGASLIDSPVGLAAYLLQKFSTATDANNVNKSDGGLTENFTLDELLTNIMIYYKESFSKLFTMPFTEIHVSVPTAVANFPNEVFQNVRTIIKHYYNLVQFTDMSRGGHFVALEEPKLLTDDIKRFVKKVLELENNSKLNLK